MVMELVTIVADPAYACKDTCEQASLQVRGRQKGQRNGERDREAEDRGRTK